MAKQDINLGTQPTGVGGDTNRSANVKMNANLTELYKAMGGSLSGGNGSVLPATGLPIANGGTGATTAEGARKNLILGTAATRNTGTTAETIPTYASFTGVSGLGYGGRSALIQTEVAENTLNNLAANQFHSTPFLWNGSPLEGASGENQGAMLHIQPYWESYAFQLWNPLNKITPKVRIKNYGAWSGWSDLYCSGNNIINTTTTAALPNVYIDPTDNKLKKSTQTLGTAATGTLTNSVNDITADRVTKVGDFGLGGKAIVLSNSQGTLDTPSSLAVNGFPNFASVGSVLYGSGIQVPIPVNNSLNRLIFAYNKPEIYHVRTNDTNLATNQVHTIHKLYTAANTTVDANGFIKAASPIVQLYADHIELNDEAQAQEITFEKLGVGDYLIKGSLGFAQSGWYVEQPKDANGNVYHAVIYNTLENSDISIKTYEQKLDGVKIVADLNKPVDVKENRFISIRLQELPQPEVEEGAYPDIDPTITDYQGNPAPSPLHELENGIWVISEENAATLERERLEKMPDLTRRQFRLVLALNGYDLSQIETLINSIEDPMQRQITMIEWQDATTFHRTNPSLIVMAGLMGLDAETVDQLWLQASTL